jgi:isopenicillin N synthase-like dioxygenase
MQGTHSPIHGPNQWPTQLPEFDRSLRLYIDHMLDLGAAVMRGVCWGGGHKLDRLMGLQ